ncbi:MAG: GNAT family N-acetyltransferase [Saprospiraceae bacterium]|nr:GNAT family N-acetyltransferase [Saprospiraceae bacterium]
MPIREIPLSRKGIDLSKVFDCICKGAIPDTVYDIVLTDNIQSIRDVWMQDPPESKLMGLEFLSVMDSHAPKDTRTVYGLVSKEGLVLARFCLQILEFDAEERLKLQDHSGHIHSYLDQVALASRQFLARYVKMRVIVMGSMLAAGPFGICFHPSVQKLEKEKLISHLTKFFFESKQIDASLFILKDLPAAQRLAGICLHKYPSYYEFTVQPNMLMVLDPDWKNLDDYKSALHSKYRIKVNKVLRTGSVLKFHTLSEEEIHHLRADVYALYQEVAVAAGFNMVELDEGYFCALKNQLKQNFDLVLVRREDKIVAFYTVIMDGSVMHAHFLGYSREENKAHEIYHNILLRLVEEGIRRSAKEINFARTALEIKSSVGAVPEELYSYIAHKSKWVNKLLPHILEFLKPRTEWTPRSPFK